MSEIDLGLLHTCNFSWFSRSCPKFKFENCIFKCRPLRCVLSYLSMYLDLAILEGAKVVGCSVQRWNHILSIVSMYTRTICIYIFLLLLFNFHESERTNLSRHHFIMHFNVSPKSVNVLSKVLKRTLTTYKSPTSALLLSEVMTWWKCDWS